MKGGSDAAGGNKLITDLLATNESALNTDIRGIIARGLGSRDVGNLREASKVLARDKGLKELMAEREEINSQQLLKFIEDHMGIYIEPRGKLDLRARERVGDHPPDAVFPPQGKGGIVNVPPLTTLGPLKDLNLYNNQITDVSPLRGLTELIFLNLAHNLITDVSPLEGLNQLRDLNLSQNQIADVSPLRGLTELKVLHLNNNHIADVSPLGGLMKLTTLFIEAQLPALDDEAKTVLSTMEQSGVRVYLD
jgi:hypothetical protein